MTNDDAPMVVLVLSWFALIPVTFLCIGALMLFVSPSTAESKVETEMQEFLKKPSVSQG
jgi:ACR3 family arsenite efflux pump ArsB